MSFARYAGEPGSPRRRWSMVAAVALFLLFFLSLTSHLRPSRPEHLEFPVSLATSFAESPAAPRFVKPANLTVVGLVFYGRKSRVEMLRCYLERNLVDHGGWLDEIHWVINTHKQPDLDYLEQEILPSSSRYKKIDLSSEGIGFEGYEHAWSHLDRGKLYLKIDDDVVWFADDTIPRVVDLKVKNSDYFLVSANIINSPLMGWVHYHMGALHPYLPELDPPHGVDAATRSWKASDYPFWNGEPDFRFELDAEAPYKGHRWLRLEHDSDLGRTPASHIEYSTWGIGLSSWAVAAQEHYSFLENLEKGQLNLYKGGNVWKTDYDRLSINFMAIWADDVLDNLPMDTVDEEWLTTVLPKKLGKSVAVDMHALATHFTFGTQGEVEKTDLLTRYHAYAQENACPRTVSRRPHRL